MLEVRNVCKAYGCKLVLDDFSMAFPDAGVVAISAPSGAGKTTLLRLIAGLEQPDSGEILLPDRARISVVFQEDRLLHSLDVRGNVAVVLSGSAQDIRRADECLARCGLSEVAAQPVVSLSGGMKRRVAIARAIAFGGDILLLDEPFKGLDSETKRTVADFVFENRQSRLIIMITHDLSEAKAYADTILEWDKVNGKS